jgi:hypothetical protein
VLRLVGVLVSAYDQGVIVREVNAAHARPAEMQEQQHPPGVEEGGSGDDVVWYDSLKDAVSGRQACVPILGHVCCSGMNDRLSADCVAVLVVVGSWPIRTDSTSPELPSADGVVLYLL